MLFLYSLSVNSLFDRYVELFQVAIIYRFVNVPFCGPYWQTPWFAKILFWATHGGILLTPHVGLMEIQLAFMPFRAPHGRTCALKMHQKPQWAPSSSAFFHEAPVMGHK